MYKKNSLTLTLKDKEILTIDINELSERQLLSNKIIELENSLKEPIVLMKNEEFPFFELQFQIKLILLIQFHL